MRAGGTWWRRWKEIEGSSSARRSVNLIVAIVGGDDDALRPSHGDDGLQPRFPVLQHHGVRGDHAVEGVSGYSEGGRVL